MGDVEDACRGRGLRGTVGSSPPGAGLTLSKIKDAGTPAVGVHGQKRSAAGLFHIVAVRGDGKDVDKAGYRV